MKINHKNIGDIQKHAYLEGTILKVYSADEDDFTGEPEESRIDTADIKIAFTRKDEDGYDEEVEIFGDRIPIFYHCSHGVGKRANGALEGASGAFSEDDEIIVQCEILSDKHYKPLRVMGHKDKPKVCAWQFQLFRDDDTTIRDGAGNITKASGYTIDPTLLYKIQIEAGGERVSLHINNYVVKNEDDTYTLKNKNKNDFVFGNYWTFSAGVWYYDDTAGYPYNPKTGYFNPVNGHYTVNIPTEKVGGLLGNYGGNSEYWILSEDEKIWHFDNGEWTGSYNLASKYYTIYSTGQAATAKVVSPAETAPNDTEFWVTYNCREYFVPDSHYEDDDGWCLNSIPILVGYPYKYKKAEQYEEENKISIGIYEANVPYWKMSDHFYDPEPTVAADSVYLCTPDGGFALIPGTVESVDMSLAEGAEAGYGYSIDDILTLADAIPCAIPREDGATVRVTDINENGGVLEVVLVTGGHEHSGGGRTVVTSSESGVGCKVHITGIKESNPGYGFFVGNYSRKRTLKTSIPYYVRRRIWARAWISTSFHTMGYAYGCVPPICRGITSHPIYYWPYLKYYTENDVFITDVDYLYYHTPEPHPPYAVINDSIWENRPSSIEQVNENGIKLFNELTDGYWTRCKDPEGNTIDVDVALSCTGVDTCKHFFIEFQYED